MAQKPVLRGEVGCACVATHTTHKHTGWANAAGGNNRGPASGSISSDRKRAHMTCRGQQAVIIHKATGLLHRRPTTTTTTTTNTNTNTNTTTNTTTKTPANALEAAPRRGLLLPLLPHGLRVSVPEVRRHELGERTRVLVGPHLRGPTVLGQRLEARYGPHGTTKTAVVRTRRADQATARASAASDFAGPRCGRGSRARAVIPNRRLQKRLRSVLALCFF